MNWGDIISYIITFAGGGGLAALFSAKATKRLKGAEADSASVAALQQALELVRQLQEEKDALSDKLVDLKSESISKGHAMCMHYGCKLRRPVFGQGHAYYEQHKGEEDLGADYTPVEDLLAQYKRRPEQTLYGKKEEKNG